MSMENVSQRNNDDDDDDADVDAGDDETIFLRVVKRNELVTTVTYYSTYQP